MVTSICGLRVIMIGNNFRFMSFSFQYWCGISLSLSLFFCWSISASLSLFLSLFLPIHSQQTSIIAILMDFNWLMDDWFKYFYFLLFSSTDFVCRANISAKTVWISLRQISLFLSFVISVPLHQSFLFSPSQLPSNCPCDLWWLCAAVEDTLWKVSLHFAICFRARL